ncbi:MAG: hypothetical protein U0470_03500 [Anaerolineae bacterium]
MARFARRRPAPAFDDPSTARPAGAAALNAPGANTGRGPGPPGAGRPARARRPRGAAIEARSSRLPASTACRRRRGGRPWRAGPG